jgi:RNA polymerase sigma factor (sigma-70 family)
MEVMASPVPVDALVTAAAGGDRDAFARLVDQTRGLVASIAVAILRDVDASHDVAQDVFLSAWRDLRKLREPASFLPWLRQMTRNRAHHVLRSRVRERRVIPARLSDRTGGRENAFAGKDLLSIAVDAQSPAAALIADEDRRRLADAIDALPDEAREVVTLYYREGQSARQVAMLLGMREDTVKQRLSRARQRLRAALLDEVGETLRTTAPGAAFTAGVMALTVAAPSTAAAAGFGVSMSHAAGSSLLLKIAAAIGGALLGIAGGVAGVLIGTRRLQRQARDAQERQALRRFTIVAVCTVATAGLSIPLGWSLTESPWAPVASYVGLLSALGVLYFGWLPRIVARRLEAERREDPDAVRRQRRERLISFLGYIVGALSGGAGLIAGLWSVVT